MTAPTREDVYAALADGIDRHGPDRAEMFLAKVCLPLSNDLCRPDRAPGLIAAAQVNMKGMRNASERGAK